MPLLTDRNRHLAGDDLFCPNGNQFLSVSPVKYYNDKTSNIISIDIQLLKAAPL